MIHVDPPYGYVYDGTSVAGWVGARPSGESAPPGPTSPAQVT
jgi:hypothetical protein